MQDDIGKRIRAARAYANISQATLAESVSLSRAAIERLEAGLENLGDDERRSIIRTVGTATGLPEQFFTVDYDELAKDAPPVERLHKVDVTLERITSQLDRIESKL